MDVGCSCTLEAAASSTEERGEKGLDMPGSLYATRVAANSV
jgi:hypothetical protein